ncbi:MAG: bifunctional riboflavin kinase/FAD synthetase [Butyrivibrio sp.]
MIFINERDFKLNEKTVVTFGKFDGLHRGHKKILTTAKEIARRENMPLTAFTFRVAPGCRFDYMDKEQITTFEERRELFEKMGVDILVEYSFDEQVAGMEPIAFIETVIKNKLNAAHVVVGEDWTFGKDRMGNGDLLKASQKLFDFTATIIQKEVYDSREISSTWIREEIKSGNMENVNILLGYPYMVAGEIVQGARIGRTMGFPTANIIPAKEKLLPPYGVYASKIFIKGNEYFGVTNIGIKPTVSEVPAVTIETYILDFNEDIYGEKAVVLLFHFQRPEMNFGNLEMLKNQLERDTQFTRTYFLI